MKNLIKNINWKVRFNKENRAFCMRFALAIALPVMTYFGLKFEDLKTWGDIGNILVKFISNPYLVGLTIINALNMIPDPTTKGITDSERAMTYDKPYVKEENNATKEEA